MARKRVPSQASAIPVRVRSGFVEVALITTVGGKRWIVPKGNVEPEESPRVAALREAQEEAGLLGELSPEPVGTYEVGKGTARSSVVAFLLSVDEELATWPERELRTRIWLELGDACSFAHPRGLRRIMRDLHAGAVDPLLFRSSWWAETLGRDLTPR